MLAVLHLLVVAGVADDAGEGGAANLPTCQMTKTRELAHTSTCAYELARWFYEKGVGLQVEDRAGPEQCLRTFRVNAIQSL